MDWQGRSSCHTLYLAVPIADGFSDQQDSAFRHWLAALCENGTYLVQFFALWARFARAEMSLLSLFSSCHGALPQQVKDSTNISFQPFIAYPPLYVFGAIFRQSLSLQCPHLSLGSPRPC
jgi:hypothetical protein